MFRIGLLGFGAAWWLCSLAPTMELLILAQDRSRADSARSSSPARLSIITATFEGKERGRAIGLWAAGTSATNIIGPLVGGFLVQFLLAGGPPS